MSASPVPTKTSSNTEVNPVPYNPASLEAGEGNVAPASKMRRFVDSFKQVENQTTTDANGEKVTVKVKSPLDQSLKTRHLQMIAIGGSIGTGLFIGAGKALFLGGPASLLIAFFLIGAMLYSTIQSLGELSVRFPVTGAFSTFSARFIDPAWGFAMGWNYGIQWLVVFPLELVAASITVQYWNSSINPALWVAIFYALIVTINLFGVKGYGEAEFMFSLIKVVTVIGFIILGIVINVGGVPNGEYIGGQFWHIPGAFNHGFKGLCSVFVTAAFSFSGTEIVGLAAAETSSPEKTLPRATKQVFWRITLFYLLSLTILGLIVPFTDPGLLGDSSASVSVSPFVIAIKNAGIRGLPSVMNTVVLLSILSVANSAVYGCSRTITGLAENGLAPPVFNYIDRNGRPLAAMLLVFVIGLLCFVTASKYEGEIFSWLLSLTGLSAIFTWLSICLCHIRFRAAMKAQGRSLDELTFKSQVGVWGSWFGLIFNILVLIAQFWTALFPVGSSGPSAVVFFKSYLAAPIVLVCFVFYKVWRRSSFVSLKDMDLDAGRREVDHEAVRRELEEEKAFIASRGFLYRTFRFWC